MWCLRVKRNEIIHHNQRKILFSLFKNDVNISLSSNAAGGDINREIAVDDLHADDALHEALEKKRNKSGLPEKVYQVYIKRELPTLVTKDHFKMRSLRKRYGLFGKRSGVNPGIAWPTKEELMNIIEDNMLLDPPLERKIQNIKARNEEKMRERMEYEAEVEKNMEKLEENMKQYHDNIAKKEAAAEALRQKKALLREEISEFLGYDVDPKDPKFEEAVEMKEKERKKALKAKKQQEAYEKMIAKLLKIAEGSKEDAAEKADESSNSDNKTNP